MADIGAAQDAVREQVTGESCYAAAQFKIQLMYETLVLDRDNPFCGWK
jgi:hypothetical protein